MRTPANFIGHMRVKLGLTQEFMAKKLNISRPTYMQIEHNKRDLTISEMKTVANIFGLSVEDFMNKKEPSINIEVQEAVPKVQQSDIRISVPQEKIDKFKQVLLYILKKVGGKPNIGMTALYKLLYFIDFDYYEKYEEQLMGLTYIKNHFGPTPVLFSKIIQEMIKNNEVEEIKSKFYQHEQKKYLINPAIILNLKGLNGQEKEHIDQELERLSEYNPTKLSELSHKDVPWLTTEQGKIIDYESVFYRTAETSVREY